MWEMFSYMSPDDKEPMNLGTCRSDTINNNKIRVSHTDRYTYGCHAHPGELLKRKKCGRFFLSIEYVWKKFLEKPHRNLYCVGQTMCNLNLKWL